MSKMKKLITLLAIGLSASLAFAQQRPVITGFDKPSTTVGETIVISGSNFPTSTASLQVNFGSGKANVVSTSATEIRATVPATATYGPIAVTDLSSGLVGYSSQYFTLSFGGSSFDTDALDTRLDFATNQQNTYDLCNCDFNGDGLLDVAIANNSSANVSVFQNVSTVSTSNFVQVTSINTIDNNLKPVNTVATECFDLNGDGLPDLVFSSEERTSKQIFIYENTSSGGTISFNPLTPFALPLDNDGNSLGPRVFKLSDLDLDGKPEIIVSQTANFINEIFIYRNTSNGGISFDSSNPIRIAVTGANKTGTLDIADLDNDQLPDIVTAPYASASSRVFILKNSSINGSISFGSTTTLSTSATWLNIQLADINNDGFNDIVYNSTSAVRIALNSGTTGNFNFSASDESSFSVPGAFGLAAGDINGDGNIDIAVSSTANNITILENLGTSTPSPSFTISSVSTDFNTRNVQIADYNGDAKPDIGFTHRSEDTAFGFFSVLINRNCISPVISPSGLTFCTGSPFTLEATNSINTTYNWTTSGDVTLQSQTGNEATFVVNSGTSATITVGITTTDGSCTTSKEETFTLTGGTPPAAPTITNSNAGTICAGTEFTLSAPSGQEEYLWTYPDGTTASTETITISDASVNNAGDYTLRIKPAGGCYSNVGSLSVSVDQPPIISIANTGEDLVCANSSTTLQVPDYTGYSYQWKSGGSNVGTDSNTLSVSSTGDYTVTITSETTGCSFTSASQSITSYSVPSPSISVASEICTDVALSFDASASTGQTGATLAYSWDFGDGSSGTGVSPTHAYSNAGDFTVTLTTSYSDLNSCSSSTTQVITVSNPPSNNDIIGLISPNPLTTEKCPEDALTLTLPSGYQSYSWSFNGSEVSTSNTVDVTTNTNQDAVDVTLDVVTDIGCTVENTVVTVNNFANSGFDFSSPSGTFVNDSLELTENANLVSVTVSNGTDFSWSPADLLDATSGTTVTVYPRNRVSVLTVTGTDNAGCTNTSDVTIITPGVIARKSFSPNGDGIGYECWEILNSDNLQGCAVYIYDEKGSIVLKANSPFTDNCVWNGNVNNGSTPAPAGVYYFVFKCEDSSLNQTGSILLAR
ncbi:MAG: hypothetical protein CMB80_34600 [Flammeovirgaceae bacterium]|nr:hypothetical protein [Flammeovirgaceae bacterium]MBR09185.1 hypothetical protein [Rickettsiales bacterium]